MCFNEEKIKNTVGKVICNFILMVLCTNSLQLLNQKRWIYL